MDLEQLLLLGLDINIDDLENPDLEGSGYFGAEGPEDMPREPAPPGFVWTYRTRGCTEGGGIIPIHSWGLDRVGNPRDAKSHVEQSLDMAFGSHPWTVGLAEQNDGSCVVCVVVKVESDVEPLERFFGSHVDGVPLVVDVDGDEGAPPISAPTFGADDWWWWHFGRPIGVPYRRRPRRRFGRRWGRWGWLGPSRFGMHKPAFGDDET